MHKISKQERKILLDYMAKRPYAEVYQLIAMLVGLKPLEERKEGKKENGKKERVVM